MGKRAVLLPLGVVVLSGLLAWRVQADNARKHAPSSGSAIVEGVETFVSPKTSGRLVRVLVDEGDPVKAGQLVAELDCTDQEIAVSIAEARVRAAEAQLTAAEAGFQNAADSALVSRAQAAAVRAQSSVLTVEQERATRDTKRAEELQRSGSIAEVELEHLTSRLRGVDEQLAAAAAQARAAELGSRAASTGARVAQANVGVARASVGTALAELARAKSIAADCRLTAPRGGIVTERLLEPGAVVGPAARILTVVDLAKVTLTFFLPNAELARARPGGKTQVRVDAYPGRVFSGVVKRVAAEAEFTPRNVQTREDRDRLVYAVDVEVDNAEGLLRAGMPAEVVLEGPSP